MAHYLEEHCTHLLIYLAGEDAFPGPGGCSQTCELFMSTQGMNRMDHSAKTNLKNILIINYAANEP